MKKTITAIFLFVALVAKAQTADEIVKKHLDARGGLDKIKALQSMVMYGNMVQSGTNVEMKFTYAQDKAYRVDFTAVEQTGYNLVTTAGGWTFNPFAGQTEANPMPAEQLKDAQAQLDMQGPLVDYKAKGNTVEYLGKESIQGVDYFKLKLTRASGTVTTYFLDKDYLISRSVSMGKVQGTEQEVSTEYSDYKKTPEGYVFAYKRVTNGTEIIFDKIEVNPKLDDSVFKAN